MTVSPVPKKKPQHRSKSKELLIHREDGVRYRPFKSVERINAIDRKKESLIDPRLIIPGVDHKLLGVWDISDTSPSCSSPSPTTKTVPETPTQTYALESTSFQSGSFSSTESPQSHMMQPFAQCSMFDSTPYPIIAPDYLQLPSPEESLYCDPSMILDSYQLSSFDATSDGFGDQSSGLANNYDFMSQSVQLDAQFCTTDGGYLGFPVKSEAAQEESWNCADAVREFESNLPLYSCHMPDSELCYSTYSTPPPLSPANSFDSSDSDGSWVKATTSTSTFLDLCNTKEDYSTDHSFGSLDLQYEAHPGPFGFENNELPNTEIWMPAASGFAV